MCPNCIRVHCSLVSLLTERFVRILGILRICRRSYVLSMRGNTHLCYTLNGQEYFKFFEIMMSL